MLRCNIGGASFLVVFERAASRHEPDIWTHYAGSLELSVDGNRLIAREIAEGAGKPWRLMVRSVGGLVRVTEEHRHLPPV